MIRVAIIQPSLAKYRVPVYRDLARRKNIKLHVVYGEIRGIANVAPEGFSASYQRLRFIKFGFGHLLWHFAQIFYAKRQHCDVLVLSWDVHYASLIPAILRAKINGVKVILWGHGFSKNERPWRAFIRQIPARLADNLIFYNTSAALKFQKQFGFEQHRIHIALNSLDQATSEQAITQWLSQSHLLEDFKIDNELDGKPVMLFCSRLVAENRVDLLIKATEIIRKVLPDVLAVVIGGGPVEDELHRLVNERNLSESVKFIGAVYDEDKLAPWFLSANVYCYPENIGLSLLHAFGYGLPVVTSDRIEAQGPEIEALKHGVNGLFYKHGDLHNLAETLLQVLTDKSLCVQLSREANCTVIEQFSLDRMVDGFVSAITASIGSAE